MAEDGLLPIPGAGPHLWPIWGKHVDISENAWIILQDQYLQCSLFILFHQ